MRIEALDISYLAGLVPNGAQGWNRTSDTAIFSRMLYQLSYLGRHPDTRRKGVRPLERAPMTKGRALGKGVQSSLARSSGSAGGPGTA